MLKTSQLVPIENVDAEMIEFEVNSIDYVSFFAHASDYLDIHTKEQLEEQIGFDLPDETYQFKFDTLENVTAEKFFYTFTPPIHKPKHIRELGNDLESCIKIHREQRGVEAYYVFAVRKNLYKFYGRILKRKELEYGYRIFEGLGEEGLGYVVCW